VSQHGERVCGEASPRDVRRDEDDTQRDLGSRGRSGVHALQHHAILSFLDLASPPAAMARHCFLSSVSFNNG